MTGHSWRQHFNISKHETTMCFYWGVGTFLSCVSGNNTRCFCTRGPDNSEPKIRFFEQNIQTIFQLVWFVWAALNIKKSCAMTRYSDSECRRREEVMTKVMNDMKRITEGRSCDFSFESNHRWWWATWPIQREEKNGIARARMSFCATCSHNASLTKDEKPSTLWYWRFRWIDSGHKCV